MAACFPPRVQPGVLGVAHEERARPTADGRKAAGETAPAENPEGHIRERNGMVTSILGRSGGRR